MTGGWRACRDHRRQRKEADDELRRFAEGTAARRRDLLDIQARASVFIHPVTVTDIHDEHAFAQALERDLDAARQRVWMWPPWIANRVRRVVPLTKSAVDRGVRVTVFLRPDEDRNMARE